MARSLSGQVNDIVLELHETLRNECESRWVRRLGEGFLDELRRLKARSDPNANTNLRLPTLGDPLFLLWSMHNTRTVDFPEIEGSRQFTIKRMIDVRNLATHEPENVTQGHLDYARRFADHAQMSLLASSSATLAPTWPPKIVPPPPGRKPVRQVEGPRPTASSGLDPEGLQVLLIYLVCDVSASMSGPGIDTVTDGIATMVNELVSDPVVADKVLLSVLTFSTKARIELPLSRPLEISGVPHLEASGVTNYGEAFVALRSAISADVVSLPVGLRPLRPVVFMLTDGDPNPDGHEWIEALDDLGDAANPYAPSMVVFPCGHDAKRFKTGIAGLRRSSAPYIWEGGVGMALGEALRSAIQSVTRSVIGTVIRDDGVLELGM